VQGFPDKFYQGVQRTTPGPLAFGAIIENLQKSREQKALYNFDFVVMSLKHLKNK